MAMLEFLKGETKRVNLTFTDETGARFNIAGYNLIFATKQNYTDTGTLFTLFKDSYHHDVPVSGETHLDFSSANTNQCVGDYLASFFLQNSGDGINSGIFPFQTDGMRILPSLYPF